MLPLLGHLTAVHDRMLPLLGIGKRLHPELDETYLNNPDRTLADPVSAADLKNAWREVNTAIISGVERFSVDDWLKKDAAVSEEDFAKEPTRNRLTVFSQPHQSRIVSHRTGCTCKIDSRTVDNGLST